MSYTCDICGAMLEVSKIIKKKIDETEGLLLVRCVCTKDSTHKNDYFRGSYIPSSKPRATKTDVQEGKKEKPAKK